MSAAADHYQRAEIAQDAAACLQANRQPGPGFTATEALLDALVHATLALTSEFSVIRAMLEKVADE